MDLKDLNNYQLVLLTLLVSFVTSIATGIITVYLLQQSPTVSSVINQVIQRTVEKVAPESTTVTTAPQVVFVKEGDLVPVVADKIKKALVSVEYECGFTPTDPEAATACTPKSYAFFTKSEGEFFSIVPVNQLVSVVKPFTVDSTYTYKTISKSDTGMTYNSASGTDTKKLVVPGTLVLTKTIPHEGETLVLFDPKTSSVKKMSVETASPENKQFTVDRNLAGYYGLPVVNLDGQVVALVGSKDGVLTLIPSAEILSKKFSDPSLTSAQ